MSTVKVFITIITPLLITVAVLVWSVHMAFGTSVSLARRRPKFQRVGRHPTFASGRPVQEKPTSPGIPRAEIDNHGLQRKPCGLPNFWNRS